MNETKLQFHIHARLDAVDEVCGQVQSWLQSTGLSSESFPVILLLRESLNNAILHGSGNDPHQHVLCRIQHGRKWLSIVVNDEGPGFNWVSQLSRERRDSDTNGRGLSVYRLYADEVLFNRRGNRVLLRRRLPGGHGNAKYAHRM